MFHPPTVESLIAMAEELGFHLSRDEAVVYRSHLVGQMELIDGFLQSRVDEPRPPLRAPARDRGRRPSQAEDPLNAWTWKCLVEGAAEGPLRGKTVSFKDHIAVAGVPMTIGAFALEGLTPDVDATVVTRALDAGATVVGKNTMMGLSGGYGLGSPAGDYGRPLNPHHPDHMTGGSSSGSAVAVAAGEVDISFGGDQGGSIRIPAAFCGTVGLKPTFGLISHFGIGYGAEQSVDYTGPLARTVEDVAAALDATAGPDGYDPRQGARVPQVLRSSDRLSDGVNGIRIGVLDEGFDEADEEVTGLVTAALDILRDAGAEVVRVSVPEHRQMWGAYFALMAEGGRALKDVGYFGAFSRTYYPAEIIAAVNRFWFEQSDLLTPRTKLNLLVSEVSRRTYFGRVYAKAHNVRPTYVAAYDRVLGDVDVLALPTCPITAPRCETPADPDRALVDSLTLGVAQAAIRNTAQFNYTGHPALAVPVGKSGGLPVSMQLVGRFYEDADLLQVAYAYEHSVDWEEVVRVEPRESGPTTPART